MRLFRSEEHLDNWCHSTGQPRGETLSLQQGWQLSSWYIDRHKPDWQRKTPAEAQAFFASIGLTSPFWDLS